MTYRIRKIRNELFALDHLVDGDWIDVGHFISADKAARSMYCRLAWA